MCYVSEDCKLHNWQKRACEDRISHLAGGIRTFPGRLLTVKFSLKIAKMLGLLSVTISAIGKMLTCGDADVQRVKVKIRIIFTVRD